jgi:hypothetical protein
VRLSYQHLYAVATKCLQSLPPLGQAGAEGLGPSGRAATISEFRLGGVREVPVL